MKFYDENKLQDFQAGKISANWKVAEIKDIASVKEGIYGKRSDDGDILQLKADSIQSNGKINNQAFARITIDRIANDYLLGTGDVLLNNRNSSALVGKSAIYRGEFSKCVFGNLLTRIRIHSQDVLPEWLLYMLMQFHSQGFLRAISTRAVNQALLKKGTVEKIKIPVPPISEQHSVVKVLSVVDSVIELANMVIAKTERLKKGLMQKLLTEGIGHIEYKNTSIGKTPKTWQVVRIGDIAETSSGGTPSRSKKEYFDGKIPWVKSGELKDNTLYATEETISNEGLQNSAAKIFPKGTLLIALYGATVGKTAILGIDATTNQAVCAILPKGDTVNPEFLKYYIIFRREQLIAVSAGGAQPNISQEIIRFTNVPLPQPQEQRKIAEILLTLDKELEIERAEMGKLENTKHGFMDLLLTGKIRVRMD